ncbi:hypothetical protein ACE6H2_000393 [Prunus campanulata]
MPQCSLLTIGNRLVPTPPFTNWEAFARQNQSLLVAASLPATMRTHISSIIWLLQASQQPLTNISWLLKYLSNHQTTFLPPFDRCKHSNGHSSHSSTIITTSPTFSPLKSIIFSIKPHQA